MKITTNNVPRPVLDSAELSQAEREQFDYLDWQALDAGTESASFFRYRGELYDLANFTRLENTPGWEGGFADTFFSGILVRLTNDGDSVIVGTYYE
jgi:hypothetical protein